MFNENNSIVVLDDDEESLLRISRVFNLHGIGCKTIKVNAFDLPQVPLQGVRLLFLDINFITVGDNKAIYGFLCQILKAFISIDNGPFVLVFWTTNSALIEDFKNFVNRDQTYKTLPNPIAIFELDKTRFTEETLLKEVEKIYSNSLVKCLFSFESELKIASEDCLYQITKLVKIEERWGEHLKYQEAVKNLFTKIAIETVGFENGKKNPDRAIKEMLAPVFLYSLLNNDSTTWRSFLCIGDLGIQAYKAIDIASNLRSYLNTYMHIHLNPIDAEARGSVRIVNCEDEVFKNCVGYTKKEWVENRLLSERVKLPDSYSVVALEISAACDYAQGKKRLHKYILGVMFKHELESNISSKCKQCGDNVYHLGFTFMFNNTEQEILFDLNSVISEESTTLFPLLGNALFLFKSDLMNAILSRYSNHISRIGFNCFRGK